MRTGCRSRKVDGKMRSRKGFTLIEILLVVVIIGIMLAVIVPRAWRANIDAKYAMVRQSGSELCSYGLQWAEEQLNAQSDDSTATINTYLITLCSSGATNYLWTGADDSNWNKRGTLQGVTGRNTTNAPPETSVEGIVPPEKVPRNPFNGASYFLSANVPSGTYNWVPGALAGSYIADTGGWNYFALLFQGTDNKVGNLGFHAGQDNTSIEGLRNGIFFARSR